MQLIISNPLGWWGLAMIPALVLIHCLHRNRQPVVISTLFLVRQGASERHGGRKFIFWKHSITFWMQVLAALLITWLLLQPRWIGEQTQQQVALVLDSSLSMDAFRDNLSPSIAQSMEELAATAAHTDWLLMESDPRAPILYRGSDREALLTALESWQPALGTHEWRESVDLARALVGSEGAVIFVTDHPLPLHDSSLAVLSIGEPIENIGFTNVDVGMQAGEAVWRTLVHNYSDHPAERKWWLEIQGEPTEPRTITIPANGSLALSGRMPPGVNALTLVLDADRWTVDDRLPLVWPEPKRIAYQIQTDTQPEALDKLLKSLGETYRGTLNGQTDLLITESADLQPAQSQAPAQIIFAPTPQAPVFPKGLPSTEEHPLTLALSWNSLTVRGGTQPYTLGPGETPLVWQGSTPLIWLRERADGRDLVFNFSLQKSNALKLPATVLLIQRFVDQLREAKAGFQATNLELGQAITVSLPAAASEVHVNGESAEPSKHLRLHAPTRPGPLMVTVDEKPLLRAAAHFSDVREADLRDAAPHSELETVKREQIAMNSEADAFQAWWILLLTGVILASWHYAERGR